MNDRLRHYETGGNRDDQIGGVISELPENSYYFQINHLNLNDSVIIRFFIE